MAGKVENKTKHALRPGLNVAFYMRRIELRHISIRCESVEYSTDPVEYATELRQLI